MGDVRHDPRARVRPQPDQAARGAPGDQASEAMYVPGADPGDVSIAPDFRPPSAYPAWREDFPIDWPKYRYVERRDFMRFMVLTSFAFVVGQFWIAGQNWFRRRRGGFEIRRIASLDALAVGSSLVFDYPGDQEPCVLVRLGERDLVAFSQKCTHLSCAVIPQPAEGIFHCPCHEGIFDLRSGRPLAGPPRRPLPRILLDVRGRDVYATGVEWRTA
jgi:nitrite reductase/ring-hydroxylating ferredoxin subunit